MGSWELKSFRVLHFLFIRNRLQPPWTSLSWKAQVQTVPNQGREGIQRQERNSQETTSQLWDSVLILPQGIHIKTSLSSSAKLKSPNSVEFSSVGQSCPTLCDPMNRSTPGLPVHHHLLEFTDSRPSSQWCHPAISSSVVPFFSCPQSLPASESFPMSSVVSNTLRPMDCIMPGFPVLHYLQEFVQTHIHWVSDATQPSHLLLPPSPPAFNLSQHQAVFQWVSSSHQVAKVLELQLQHQSFQRIFRVDFLQDWLVGSPCCLMDSQESSPAPQYESIKST